MRTALFCILSLGLHTAALTHPVVFTNWGGAAPIRVTILPVPVQSASLDEGSRASIPPAPAVNTRVPTRRTPSSCCLGSFATSPDEDNSASKTAVIEEPQTAAVRDHAAVSDGIAANPVATAALSDVRAQSFDGFHDGAAYGGVGSLGVATPGAGHGSGTGSGNDNPAQSGAGSSTNGSNWRQASYRNTPRPEYPESARRAGREGRVLLRVLVDERGRARTVEINSSSGSEALDRAAAEAMRRWRFDPARYGDHAVESWLRIPIEFRLIDGKSW